MEERQYTVAELIEQLSKIEDKTSPVVLTAYHGNDGGDWDGEVVTEKGTVYLVYR